MGRLSTTVIDAVLDELFGGVNYTAPATLYIGLSTTTPNNDGTNVTEPVGNGYARVAFANTIANWTTAAARTKSNTTAITFPTATGAWGTVTNFVVYDAATAGGFYAYGLLQPAKTVGTGDTPNFLAGTFIVVASGT